MGASEPKQYLTLNGKTILEHTIEKIRCLDPRELVVVVSRSDEHYKNLPGLEDCTIVTGGLERADSVRNAIAHLDIGDQDWVMVHDAVRPCIRAEDILALYSAIYNHPVGGLLGLRVSDTVKRTRNGVVVATVDRSDLWLAQTPQMFRYGILRRALDQQGVHTDEASAVEAIGLAPLMVSGHADNIKITTETDLLLAGQILDLDGVKTA